MKSNLPRALAPFKKIFLTVFASFTAFVVTASHKAPAAVPVSKKINIEQDVRHIEVHGDILLVLTNKPAGIAEIKGEAKDVQKIKTTIKNGRLIIDAHRKKSFKKLTVYLPVSSIQSITIQGDTDISSEEVLSVGALLITLNGNSIVAVKSARKGKIKVTTTAGYELEQYNK